MIFIKQTKRACDMRSDLLTSFGGDSNVHDAIHENAQNTRLPHCKFMVHGEASRTSEPLPKSIERIHAAFDTRFDSSILIVIVVNDCS